jgi:Family of unknown function (DUF5675)
MEIVVARIWKNDLAVTGTFSVDGVQKYFSLELPELFEGQANVPDKTCIPVGTYDVQRLWSGHWDQMMPHVVGVPGRSEVEIHIANFPHDILGCIGIGKKRISDTEIGESKEAFDEFNKDFENAIAAGEPVSIAIT